MFNKKEIEQIQNAGKVISDFLIKVEERESSGESYMIVNGKRYSCDMGYIYEFLDIIDELSDYLNFEENIKIEKEKSDKQDKKLNNIFNNYRKLDQHEDGFNGQEFWHTREHGQILVDHSSKSYIQTLV